jgi:hypothetical protein
MLEEIMDDVIGFIKRFIKNRFTIRKHAEKILKSLREYPGEWKLETFTIRHKSGLRIWVTDTFLAVDLNPEKKAFNLVEKWKIYYCVRLKWSKQEQEAMEEVFEKLGE